MVTVKKESEESLKRKRPPPLEFNKRAKSEVSVKYVGVRPVPMYVPQYVATPMFILPHGATITTAATASNVATAGMATQPIMASMVQYPPARNKVVDVMTPTGEQEQEEEEDDDDEEEEDGKDGEQQEIKEEEEEHSQLAIEEGALPTPHLTAGKMVNGSISINNHSFEFQFPARGKDHDRKLFLSICNKVWSDRPQ